MPLLLHRGVHKGSMPDSSSTTYPTGASLSDILFSFVLEKYIVCDVCGLRSPSFESSSVLCISPTDISTDNHRIVRSWSPGSDGTTEILKITLQSIISPQCHPCKISLTERLFQEELKLATVLPLIYSVDHLLLSNFKPVSLLLYVVSNVFEKVMYSRILSSL